jgi:DNA-binding NarL/FixJ family response regulator
MSADAPDEVITDRERQVLELMIDGATNSQIGETLAISSGTVKSHVSQLLRKLNAQNRADAVARYLRAKGGNASAFPGS